MAKAEDFDIFFQKEDTIFSSGKHQGIQLILAYFKVVKLFLWVVCYSIWVYFFQPINYEKTK